MYVSAISYCLNHHCDETDVDCLLATVLPLSVLPVDLPIGCFFFIKISSKACERKYWPSSLFIAVPPFFLIMLIAIASLIQHLYLSCSVPMILASPHPITWFLSTTWSVIADLWVVINDSFLPALVVTVPLTLFTSDLSVYALPTLYWIFCLFHLCSIE